MAGDPIWFRKDLQFSDLQLTPDTMGTYLDMRWTALGADFISMSMPVDERTRQPYGILHGGASCALAETIGSVASFLVLDTEKYICVGLEINANHIRSAKSGYVYGTVKPVHIGLSTQVWNIEIVNEDKKLVCVSRLTCAVKNL